MALYGAAVPIEPFYGFTYSQTIYTEEELTAAGLQAGSEITVLFYEYTSTTLTNSNNWDIFIGHTSKDNFTDVSDWVEIGTLQPFAMNANPAISAGSSPNGFSDVRITGNFPFLWDGVSNIVIATDENAPLYGSNSDDFLIHESSGRPSLTYWNDLNNPDPAGPPPATNMWGYKPNLRVTATNVTCGGLPFSMNFETGSLWPTNWSIISGGTGSGGTGPTNATVFGSDPVSNATASNYAYCEASAGGPTVFTMTSGCFDFSAVALPKASFAYHAYGSDMGTINFQYSVNGIIWSNLWTSSGQQHTSNSDPATVVNVDISATALLPTVYFRFYYVKGPSFRGDIAIDDVNIDQDIAWIGLTADWHDTDNWSTGVLPDATSDVTFTSLANNQPSIEKGTGYVRNIKIESGATLNIKNKENLFVYGNWTNNGTLGTEDGLVTFAGSAQNLLNGGITDFYSVRVLNNAGIELQTGTYNIYGALYPDAGTIVTNDNLIIASNATATGRILAPPNQCTTAKEITLDLTDSYGDGWNGASLNVYIDGSLYANYTIPSGGSAANYGFDLDCGSDASFNFTSGSWDTEIGYTITVDGTLGYTGGPYGSNTGNSATGIYTNSNAYITPFNGDVTVQQYLATSINGWREFTSSVQSMTLSDFYDDGLYMSGFTGVASTFPSWTSVYNYDETLANGNKDNGWAPATNVTNPVVPSDAHRIYTGTGPYNIVLKGTPGYGPYTHNLSYENVSSAELAAAEDQKGWNFVGNPYPCPISWDQLTTVNVDDQIWIYSAEAGNYGIYAGGTGAGGGTNSVGREIAANQGVWVHASASGASVTITEAAKQDIVTDFVKTQEELPFFKIKLSNVSNSFYDEVIVGLDENATIGYDPDKDGFKLFTSVTAAPSLWMEGGLVPLSLNRISTSTDVNIDLHYSSSVIGTHKLLFTNPGVMNFNGCLVLEDMELNTYTPITDSLEYSFNSNPLLATGVRFKLHYYPTSEVISSDAVCNGGVDGSIAVEFGGTPPFSATLTSSTSVTTLFNDSVGIFENLSAGTYELEVGGGKGCASEQFQLEIADPMDLQIAQDVVDASTSGCDGAIRLDAMGGIAPYTYYINGIEGNELGSLCTGSYDVIVLDANGCIKMLTIEVGSPAAASVDDYEQHSFAVVPNPSDGHFTVFTKGNSHLRVYSVTGQIVKELKFTKSSAIDMTDVDKGVYILRDMETGDISEIVLI